jgi:hypothetical protein
MGARHKRLTLAERFWSHVITEDKGCWLWRGAPPGRQPAFNLGGPRGGQKFEAVYRVAWRLLNGREIPPGLDVCHTCDDERCCRGDHLFLGTAGDNLRDMMAKGRGRGQFPSATHCRRGHALVVQRARLRSGAIRKRCPVCENAAARAAARTRREANR